jgi:precorrin-2 dehydrogenase
VGYYPIALELGGRSVLVIGAGSVGERKVEGLLAAGARVTVVAPHLTDRLRTMRDRGLLTHLDRPYRWGDLAGQELVFVAVDDPTVAHEVRAEAQARGLWLNVADDPARCDFILPSVLRRGDLVVAVSTGGASPALARAVRETLEDVITEEYGELTALVAEVRRELRLGDVRPDATTWAHALDQELLGLVRAGHREAARHRLLASLGAA